MSGKSIYMWIFCLDILIPMKTPKFINMLGSYWITNIFRDIVGATNVFASLSNLSEMSVNKKEGLLRPNLLNNKEKRRDINRSHMKSQSILDEKLRHKKEPSERHLTYHMALISSTQFSNKHYYSYRIRRIKIN